MANTYTQIHIHLVFVVKYRKALILNGWREDLHTYISGIVRQQNHKMIAINSVTDHVHMLIGQRPVQSLSDLMEKVKGHSSGWINDHQLASAYFRWQPGYGGFSIARDDIDRVVKYIYNQEAHHQKTTFREEYLDLLRRYDVEFEEQYIFHDPE